VSIAVFVDDRPPEGELEDGEPGPDIDPVA
jgi:hypothetical protein